MNEPLTHPCSRTEWKVNIKRRKGKVNDYANSYTYSTRKWL